MFYALTGEMKMTFELLREGSLVIQQFHKHIFGCDQFGFRDQFAGCDGALMPLVSGIEESHKVERADECDFHGCCFGAP